ncbi:Acetyl-CoA:oxalate CoA-transferase [Neomoorella glycerini]|uniref:Acetyl-CoA:oxalate CoA-transferase n=1 Tax=Neomoorella glycerini TaxID=55779 RepID=A0A6I5ZPS9_9FIRM|nr:CoA transferase [Moorella glycerini]QGP91625.1 Acetyl-CoA:oxalate CoA-transferase [Moorella glycerini]
MAVINSALEGIIVLDLSRVLAAPYCGMILADLGAEVIKIEVPGKGDDAREYPPFINGESGYFMSLNRNKKSLTLNLKHPRGKEVFKTLVKHADVVLENYRPGTMDKLGLGYGVLKEINPRLIYAAISGFGQSGPYASKPAYDLIIQAMGGVMSLTAHPGGLPTRVGSAIGDIAAGMFGAIGILAALRAREVTGKGQLVDVAMLDCQVALLENAIARYWATGKAPLPTGNRHPSITPFQAFPTKDYYVICAAGNDKLWEKFCQAIGKEELVHDPRFESNRLRTENIAELEPILFEVFRQKTTAEWIEIIETAGIPCGPINTVDKVVNDPQVRAREMVVEIDHPVAGKQLIHGVPVKLSDTPGRVRQPAPVLGQHTREVLQKYGLTAEEINLLAQEGVV